MGETDAVIACCRFGLGPRRGGLKAVAGDPRGVLRAELDDVRAAVIEPAEPLASAADAMRRFQLYDDQKKRSDRKMAPLEGDKKNDKSAMTPVNPVTQIFLAEANARLSRQIDVPLGFAERLVLFWSNHFSIAVSKNALTRVIAGAFEREAIRPHVLGRFRDMLHAVERHPAMLMYLDNHTSIGPNSQQGGGGKRGLNENLAREILELHTLGVDGGYAQEDVTSFARILTGWTFTLPANDLFHGGRFTFAFGRHEPGDHTLLGRVFPEGGLEQGEAALDFLASHPSTAWHVARKLAAHFAGENPPPALVARLEKTFRESEGDLRAVARELVSADESWRVRPQKLRSPVEFVVATERLLGKRTKGQGLVAALQAMGQPLWNPPSPKGFPDNDASWGAPASVKARLDFASRIATGAAQQDPNELLEEAFGPIASRETREAVRRAESRAQGVALLLMSPEFQRR